MASEALILGLAGNVPFYPVEEYLNPSISVRLKRWLLDYRCLDYNQPVGKGAIYLLNALEPFTHTSKPIELKMWGSISPIYKDIIRQKGLDSVVEISGFIPKKDSLEKLQSCDVLVLTLALGVGEHPPFSLPGKMFDYFHVGKPILALVQPSYCAEVLHESGLAKVVDPLDKTSIQLALEQFNEQKENLHSTYILKEGFLERFGHEAMVASIADVFDEVLS